MHKLFWRAAVIPVGLLLCLPSAIALGVTGVDHAQAAPDRHITLPTAPEPVVIDSLRPDVVAHFDFEHPVLGDPGREHDLGWSATDLDLVNGAGHMRVPDGAYPGSRQSLQTRQVNPTVMGNDDWKAGVYNPDGVASLNAFSGTAGITIMGWFKMTGENPGPNSNTPDPDDHYNAVGMAGILSGDSDGHPVRALLEVINVDGELRLVALGRRIDGGASQTFAASDDWQTLLPRDEWVFLAATFNYDDGTMRLFHNGVQLDGFYTNPGDPWEVDGPGSHVTSPTDPTGIKIGGSYPQNNREANPCNCRMDSLMFLDRVVSDEEVAEQYTAFLASPPALTSVDPGSAVVLDVAVGGYRGRAPFEVTTAEMSCATGQPTGPDEAAQTPHRDQIPYRPRTKSYRYIWHSDATWSGSCRLLTVLTPDGPLHTVGVQFR
ncbi:PxKF domain-containing protein [Phytoactinopolyspora limicola]|uniref:PxKF domain-containing protein n=1 Tax=Phytoactinopolyspora limicola TaxID=2715536 RepID=UPI00140D77E7|nr:PxKF domain-containing protein [Phytoactinopolyspora limicola]